MVVKYIPVLLKGAWITIQLTGVSVFIGVILGLILAIARISKRRVISWPAYAYIEFFRTTPVLVQIIWFYFVIPVITGYDINAFQAAGLALGLNMAAFFAEIFRAGILGIEITQWHAAKVLGLSTIDTFRFVILPQAARIVLPPTCTTVILLLKGTAIASAIGTPELLRIGQLVSLETFRPVEALTTVAIIYFIMAYPLTLGFGVLEKRLRAGEN